MSQFVYTESMQPNTEKRRCHHGMSSSRAEKKKKVRAAMKSMNGKAQSKRREAASVLLPKTGAKGVGTTVFFVVGWSTRDFFADVDLHIYIIRSDDVTFIYLSSRYD